MNAGTQRLCIWSGVVLIAAFGIGLLTAGFLPPPSPDQSAEQVAQIYLSDQNRIRAGMILILLGVPFMVPFVVVLGLQMWRAEGRVAPLALIQIVTGALGVFIIALPALFWAYAAFRPAERSAADLSQYHDMGWLTLVGAAGLVMMQNLSIGMCVFLQGERTVFPRWYGYLNIWAVLLFAPGFAVYCMHSGPFAWNGLITFWIPAATFFGWFIVTIWLLFAAVADDERKYLAATTSAAPAAAPAAV